MTTFSFLKIIIDNSMKYLYYINIFIWYVCMIYSVKQCDLMNILCFGDSNTWGYRPDRKGRFDENTRWTGLLQQKLGPEYHIIEEGLCGRTTIFHARYQ